MWSQKSRFQIHSSLNTSEPLSTQNAYFITLLCMQKKVYQIPNTFPNGTLDFPHPQTPHSSVSTIAVNGTILGSCPKPNTQSVNKFSCFPSNYIQNLTTSHSFPLTPLPKPRHPYPTARRSSYFLCFHSCLPTVILHTTGREIFENHKSNYVTFLLKTYSGFPSSSVKSQL